MTGGNSVVRCRTRMIVAFQLAGSARLEADGPEGDRAGVLLQPDEPGRRVLVGADPPAGVGVGVDGGQMAVEANLVGVARDRHLVVVPRTRLQRRTT